MPFEESLNVAVREQHDDGVTCEFAIRDEFLNGNGILHGGVIASIADEAAWFAIERQAGDAKNTTTTELKVNYLLPLVGATVIARAVMLRAGKRLFVIRVDMSGIDGRLGASA
jgi:uncharacterized protein (TIGR00369 family)